jgi:hypothetical protein
VTKYTSDPANSRQAIAFKIEQAVDEECLGRCIENFFARYPLKQASAKKTAIPAISSDSKFELL